MTYEPYLAQPSTLSADDSGPGQSQRVVVCKHGGAAEEASYRACRALFDERAPNAVRKAIAAAGGERAEGQARIIAIQQALATTVQYAVAGVEAGDKEGEREADKAGRSEAGGTAGKGQRAGKQRGG